MQLTHTMLAIPAAFHSDAGNSYIAAAIYWLPFVHLYIGYVVFLIHVQRPNKTIIEHILAVVCSPGKRALISYFIYIQSFLNHLNCAHTVSKENAVDYDCCLLITFISAYAVFITQGRLLYTIVLSCSFHLIAVQNDIYLGIVACIIFWDTDYLFVIFLSSCATIGPLLM